MPRKIVQRDHPLLRGRAEPVHKDEFGTRELASLIQEMSTLLAREPDGVALAAPQVAVPKRIFIVAGLLFGVDNQGGTLPQDLAFINPKLVSRSKKTEPVEEGCLSVRGYWGFVPRSTEVMIEAQDVMGEKFSLRGRGLLAQIFQHEVDHLEGVLFTDTARDLKRYDPPQSSLQGGTPTSKPQ